MADTKDTRIRIIAEDQASSAIKGVGDALKQAGQAAQGASGTSAGMALALGAIGGAAAGVAMKIGDVLVGAISNANAAMIGFAKESVMAAAAIQPVQASFENLATGAGVSSQALITAMQQAAAGTVSQAELMKNANYALLTIGADVADKLPKMMEIARAASVATGESVDFMFKSITMGTARGSKMILDNLGIIVDAKKAYSDYASQIGASADALTEAQKKQAFLNAVMVAGDDLVKRVGTSTGGAAVQAAQLGAATKDLQATIGKALLPAYQGVLGVMGDFVNRIKEAVSEGGPLNDELDAIGKAAQDMLPALRAAADFIIGTLIPAFVGLIEKATSAGAALVQVYVKQAAQAEETKRQLVESYGTWAAYEAAMTKLGLRMIMTTQEFNKIAVAIGLVKPPLEMAADAADNMSVRMRLAMEKTATAAKQAADEIDKELTESFTKTVGSAMSGVQNTMQQHYQRMAQMASDAQLESLRSDAEYNAERTRLVAEGNTDAIAKLDAGYQKEKILRELNAKIAVVQEKAKYDAQLREQQKAFVDKMSLWLVEGAKESEAKMMSARHIIAGMKAAFGQEVAITADKVLDILELSKQEADGTIRDANRRIAASKAVTQAIKAQWQAEAAAASSGAVNWAQYQSEIDAAYQSIAAIGGGGGVAGAAKSATAKVGETTADIASTVDKMLADIASIGERLQAELPQIDADKVRSWLDRLVDVSRVVGNYMTDPAKGMKAFVEWLDKDIKPMLEKWAASVGPVADLFGSAGNIMESMSAKMPKIETSVTTFLNFLRGVMLEVGKRFDVESGLVGFIDWFDADLRPLIEKWAASAAPIADLLGSAKSAMDAMSAKVPKFETSVTTLLNLLRGVMLEVGKRFDIEPGLVGFIDWFNSDLRHVLEKWVASIKPIGDLFDTARSILDVLATKIPKAETIGTQINALMEATKLIMQSVYWYWWTTAKYDQFFNLDAWAAAKAWLETLNEAIAPIADVFGKSKSLIDSLTAKIPKADAIANQVNALLDATKLIMQSVYWYWWTTAKYDQFFNLDAWAAAKAWLETLNEAIAPIADMFGKSKSLIDALAAKIPATDSIGGKVQQLLDATKEIMRSVYWYWWSTEKYGKFFNLDAWAAAKAWLETLNEAIAPIADMFSKAKTMLDGLTAKTPKQADIGPKVQALFDATKEILQSVYWYWWSTDKYGKYFNFDAWESAGEWLAKVKAAIDPIASVFSGINSIFKALSEEIAEPKQTIEQVLAQARGVLESVVVQLNAADWQSVIASLTEETRAQMANVETAIKSVAGTISSTVSMLTDLGSAKGTVNAGKLSTLMADMRLAIGIVMTAFDGVELDTERLQAIEDSASSVRGVLDAMDGMAKMIKDINVPNTGKIATLVAALKILVPELIAVPYLGKSTKDSFVFASEAMDAVKNIIEKLNSIGWTSKQTIFNKATVASDAITGIVDGLLSMFATNQPKLTDLKDKAEQFGKDMTAVLSSIISFWYLDTEKANASTIMREFQTAVQNMVTAVITSLGTLLTYMAPGGAFVVGLQGVDLAAPMKTVAAGMVGAMQTEGVDKVIGFFQEGSQFKKDLAALTLYNDGYNIGRTLANGISAGANSVTISVPVYTYEVRRQ